MSMDGGVMKMRELTNGLEIPPGATVELKPGGYHIMMTNLTRPLTKGEKVKGSLTFGPAVATENARVAVSELSAMELPITVEGSKARSKQYAPKMTEPLLYRYTAWVTPRTPCDCPATRWPSQSTRA